MVKRGFGFIFLFVFVIFLIGFVSSASCSIQASCAEANTVMKLSSSTNAHGALYNQGAYTSYLCCDFTGIHTCPGTNKVLGLSSSTNAHAQIPSLASYTEHVCFGDFTCYNTAGSCIAGDTQMVSLSSDTNAHIGGFSDYPTKICCSPNLDYCGDGQINPAEEECDDGNVNNGDGCSYPACTIETGFICASEPSICSPICGDGVCKSANGETCSSCPADCTWNVNTQECVGGVIVPACILTSATWNETSVLEGTPVKLNIAGTNCNGKTIDFIVQEHDLLGHNSVRINPVSIAFIGTSSYGTWRAEWQDDSILGIGNPPEYHFTATVSGHIQSIESSNPMLEVTQSVLCGNGIQDTGETCATCVADVPCSSGYYCNGTAMCAPNCDLTSASWNITSVLEGASVKLNIAGTNCAGKTISFVIKEKDSGLNLDDTVIPNPSNIAFTGTSSYGTWISKWQDDTDGGQSDPPEYYFTANVVGVTPAETITSSNTNDADPLLLKVNLNAECVDINYCNDYSTELYCKDDSCNVAEASVPNSITCGDGINCGCYWDDSKTPKCNAKWDATNSTDGDGTEIVGNCTYTENSQDTCEDDNMLTRSIDALWTWATWNVAHIDRLNKNLECKDVNDVIPCPPSVQVSFFGIYSFVGVIVLVVLIYLLYSLRKKNSRKNNSKKRKGKKK